MASAFTYWVEEDMVVWLELIAQIDQPPTPEFNQSEEADWRDVIIALLK